MAVAVGDILQVTDVQVYLGQTVLNVYFYEVTEWGADTELVNVVDAFQLYVATYLDTIQSLALSHTRVIVKNLTNGIDIYEEPWSNLGAVDGVNMPSFVAWSFRLVRTTGETRHGSKRIAGVPEASTVGNDPDPGVLTALNNVAIQMANPLLLDAGGATDFEAIPVIIGRFPKDDPNAGELDLSVVNPISAAQFIRLSTQTTRRAGRGI